MSRRKGQTAIRPKRSGTRRATGALLFASLALALPTCLSLAGCDEPDSSTPAARYAVPMRSDAELAALLRELCEQAGGDRPVLVEFSAAWCSDCQRLQEMKRAEA